MAGDVHSGGQDWHPSAGMRYRLWKSEMGISRQWRAALYHVHNFDALGDIRMAHNHRAMPAASMLSNKVLVIGINHSRPNSLNRKSPGKRPKPSFCNQGWRPLKRIRTSKTTISQRNMLFPEMA